MRLGAAKAVMRIQKLTPPSEASLELLPLASALTQRRVRRMSSGIEAHQAQKGHQVRLVGGQLRKHLQERNR